MTEDLTGRTLGGFRLREPLGEGAHGSVWRASQIRLDRDVAVKILDPIVARNPETVRRFEREGRAAASLDHPNVVPVYEAGEADGLVFLAMRLVDGETLEDHAAGRGPYEPGEVAELLAPIAAALDHAHERGLVHRDVKPSNILLEDDRIYLADFGIAASVREIGNYTTGALGTAEYMAPEQAHGNEVDHRADVYGLGCVAHFLMEGRPPFTRDDLVATLMAHVNDPVPTVGDDHRDAFYDRALAKQPDERFASATLLVDALRDPAPAPVVRTVDAAEASSASGAGEGSTSRRLGPLLAIAGVVLAAIAAFVLLSDGDDPAEVADDATAEESTTPTTGEPAADVDEPEDTDGEAPAEEAAADPEGDGVDAAPLLVDGGDVDVATVRPLDSINPHQDRLAEMYITRHVLPPLMRLEEDWTLTPWLAAAPPEIVSDEPFTTRWTLRSDAVWDDGSPITARDVSRTLDYILDPAAATEATVLHEGLTIEIIDDITFDVTFPAASETHEVVFSTLHPVIKADAYDAHVNAGNDPATFMQDEITFTGGPFRLAGYDPGQRVTLVRNEAWWGEAPHLERITIRSFDSSADQVEALATGDVDIAYLETASAAVRGSAEEIGGIVIDAGTAERRIRLDMNTATGPTSELAVRSALATAIDRALIGEAATSSITREPPVQLDSLVWPTPHPANTEPFASIETDADLAAGILQEAGWLLDPDLGARFKDGEVLELRLIFDRFNALLGQTIAQNVVVGLDDIGVRVVADVLDVEQSNDARLTGDFALAITTALGDVDPVSTQFRWHSRYCPDTFDVPGCDEPGGTNIVGLRNTEIDTLLDQAAVLTGAERTAAYQAIDQRLADLLPSLPLFEMPVLVAHDPDLSGVVVSGHRNGPFASMADWGRLVSADD